MIIVCYILQMFFSHLLLVFNFVHDDIFIQKILFVEY